MDRFGCMEMYVGEFDEDPPSEPALTEQWEYYVGGEPPPADLLLKQEQLDNEHMRIGRHEHMKQLGRIEKEESAMLESSGPVLRMMLTGKRSTNTKKKSKKGFFFRKGGGGGKKIPEPPITFGDLPDEEGKEEPKRSEEFDEEESPKELEIASQNLRLREQWLKKEISTVGADPKHEKVLEEIKKESGGRSAPGN